MNKINIYLIMCLLVNTSMISCARDYMYPDYTGQETEEEPVNPVEPNEGKKSSIRDLVLIYGAGKAAVDKWTDDKFVPYVSYQNGSTAEWMFDGFLFLELNDGDGHAYTTGHAPNPGLKVHWEALIQNYFKEGQSISALDQRLDKTTKEIGSPNQKRKVVIGIPEPMRGAVQWGEVDGKMLDFSKDEDRVAGCTWFIDQARTAFTNAAFKNLELEGFYWIAEEVDHTGEMISFVGDYLKKKDMTFVWIPWWKSPGYDNAQKYGFSEVYLQPNYFFYDVPFSRLQEATVEANKHDIDLEIEFDESVLGGNGGKLNDYLDVFEENLVYDTKKLAYYQSVNTILKLYQSINPADQELYKRLSEIITKRQKVQNPPYIKH
ncbi:DUF4855 domain-containing protein [Sphingobacterium yanglingense]|uniref:Uncharacterized protein DUF4855 n=1 Tax=Sphingobacterium yanglingense TaxID=1437280 RepID=A0A4R6WNS7_9SPHI|nr:DUF4855 domain-containing protein [Sphingobacterium yanglingense]TDQ79781.1 uncharacterized protein DUF4855 [Sphingobacterium yanglingense]